MFLLPSLVHFTALKVFLNSSVLRYPLPCILFSSPFLDLLLGSTFGLLLLPISMPVVHLSAMIIIAVFGVIVQISCSALCLFASGLLCSSTSSSLKGNLLESLPHVYLQICLSCPTVKQFTCSQMTKVLENLRKERTMDSYYAPNRNPQPPETLHSSHEIP